MSGGYIGARDYIRGLQTGSQKSRWPFLFAECRVDPLVHFILRRALASGLAPGSPLPIIVSHQPTFLSYSGVYVQFLLANFLRAKCEAAGVPAELVYLCLDGDDAFDRRIRTAHFPMPTASQGSMPLSVPLHRDFKGAAQCFTPVPSDYDIPCIWTRVVKGGYGKLSDAVPLMKAALRNEADLISEGLQTIISPPRDFASFAEFNRSIIHKYLTTLGLHSIRAIKMSELLPIIRSEVMIMLKEWHDIVLLADRWKEQFRADGVMIRSSSVISPDPFWVACGRCGLRSTANVEASLSYLGGDSGVCVRCSGVLRLDTGTAALLPRVLLEDLLTLTVLSPGLVLTYAGSAEHILMSSAIYQDFYNTSAPCYIWHPRQSLNSALETAAFELSSAGHTGAKQALALATSGRDTLALSLGDHDMLRIPRAWEATFAGANLTEVCCIAGEQR